MTTGRAVTPPSSYNPDGRFKQVELWENNALDVYMVASSHGSPLAVDLFC